ncbi:MAG: hypothetical protein KGL44_07765 [Sphingomonadales bacterium]|nr:hypothetical protein [Sphingomonadales bacterium]
MRQTLLKIAALTGLAMSCCGTAQAAGTWSGVWRGTIGADPVQVCLQGGGFGDQGSYYRLQDLVIMPLEPVPTAATPNWTEARDGNPSPAAAVWSQITVSGNQLTGVRTGADGARPIALTRLAQVDTEAQPCGDLAFSAPRATAPRLTDARKMIDGIAYSVREYHAGPQFSDVSISTFQLDGATPAIRAINAELASRLPAKVEEADYFICSMANIGSTGRDGEYSDDTAPVLVTRGWVVSQTSSGSTCGGAHPNAGVDWSNWNLRTGQAVDLWTWLGPQYARLTPHGTYNDIAIMPRLRALLVKGWTRNDEGCESIGEEADSWSIRLTRKGFAFSPNLPHVALACTEDVEIGFASLAPILNPAGRAGVASFRADLRAVPAAPPALPPAYRGEWREALDRCGSDNDLDKVLNLSAAGMSGYEATGKVTGIERRKGGGITVRSDWEEGADPPQQWQDTRSLKLSRSGQTMQQFDKDGKPDGLWRRCPASPAAH